jgi:ElaB/YqjD/DUF883 family membrane-anchored ribosome-binding protein
MAESSAHSGGDKITEALKLLEEAAKDKREELRHLVTDKYVNLKQVVGTASGSMKDSMDVVKRRAAEAATHARDVGEEKARELARNLDENVHRNPWPYVGGVAVAALLLGYILGRKN